MIVDIAAVFAVTGGERSNALPLRVRAEGLSLDVQVPGQVSAWARSSHGMWLAFASFAIPTGNGRGFLDVEQWVPATAVRPCR